MKYKVGDVLVYDRNGKMVRAFIFNVTKNTYGFKYIESNSAVPVVGKIGEILHEEADNHQYFKLDVAYMAAKDFDKELKELLED